MSMSDNWPFLIIILVGLVAYYRIIAHKKKKTNKVMLPKRTLIEKMPDISTVLTIKQFEDKIQIFVNGRPYKRGKHYTLELERKLEEMIKELQSKDTDTGLE